MLASTAVGYGCRWRRRWLWARRREGWGEYLGSAGLCVSGGVSSWLLSCDGAEHFAPCSSDVFRSGERPLHSDSLCEYETLPCGHIRFGGLPLMCVVKECPKLLFVCVRLSGVYTLAEGFPVAVMGLLRG